MLCNNPKDMLDETNTPWITATASVSGYGHPAYAQALSEFGEPVALPASGGWVLRRRIGQAASYDAMGLYPLFSCGRWRALPSDIEDLRNDLVSLAMVPDPFGEYDEKLLRSCFDRVVNFKSHFIVDLQQPEHHGIRHHRYYARKALRDVRVDVCIPAQKMLDEWTVLYAHLVERHQLKGIKAFSPESFRQQFAVPGLVALRASTRDDACVGGQLWYVSGDVAYSHLTAVNDVGYELRCSYAIYAAAIEFFEGKLRWMDLGAGAGSSSENDGLTKFKEGWANAQRPAHFCGRILNQERYRELVSETGSETARYFPAYRNGELG